MSLRKSLSSMDNPLNQKNYFFVLEIYRLDFDQNLWIFGIQRSVFGIKKHTKISVSIVTAVRELICS